MGDLKLNHLSDTHPRGRSLGSAGTLLKATTSNWTHTVSVGRVIARLGYVICATNTMQRLLGACERALDNVCSKWKGSVYELLLPESMFNAVEHTINGQSARHSACANVKWQRNERTHCILYEL